MNAIARVYPEPVQAIERELVPYEPQIAEALPPGVTIERFKQVALAAITRSLGTGDYSDLATADRASLMAALVQAAGSGLLPDGKEGALVRRKRQVAWMPMVQGIIKLARNSGLVSSLVSACVYKGERFEVHLGDRQEIIHVWDAEAVERGDIVAAYAIAKLRNPDGSVGDRVVEPMTRKQIDKIMEMSTAGARGPWGKHYGEMARKTALHRLFKSLPRAVDDKMLAAIYSVEDEYDFGARKPMAPAKGPTIDGEAGDGGQAKPPGGGASFDFIAGDGQVFTVDGCREWTHSWEAIVERAAREEALGTLREDWERNRGVFSALRKAGFKDAVDEVEDEIRVVLGIEAPESTGRGDDFVTRMQKKYAKPADPPKAAVDAVAQGKALEDSMPGGAGDGGGETKPGQAETPTDGIPWLDYDEGNKIVLRAARSPKEYTDGVWGVLARIGANPQWIADYAREMEPHISSLAKHDNPRVARLAKIGRQLIVDAGDRARAAERGG